MTKRTWRWAFASLNCQEPWSPGPGSRRAPPQAAVLAMSFTFYPYRRWTSAFPLSSVPLGFLGILRLMGFDGLYRSYRNGWMKRFGVNYFSKDKSLWTNAPRRKVRAGRGGGRTSPAVRGAASLVSVSPAQPQGAPPWKVEADAWPMVLGALVPLAVSPLLPSVYAESAGPRGIKP